jgi:hypothetical protein
MAAYYTPQPRKWPPYCIISLCDLIFCLVFLITTPLIYDTVGYYTQHICTISVYKYSLL